MNVSHSLSSYLRRIRSGTLADPVRDWLILLALSLVALLGIIIWNVWAFDTVAQGGVIGPAPTSAAPAFDRSSIDAINNVFQMRSTEEAKYVTGVYSYSDPSQ
jgi:hypothetical protein